MNKLVMLVFTVIIGVVLIANVMIPIISDASNDEVTYTNDGVRMSPVGEQTVTVSYASNMWTVNGVDVGYTAQPLTQGTIMLYSTGSSSRAGYFYSNHDDTYTRTSIASTSSMTVEYVGASKTANITTIVSGTTYTATYEYVGEIYYKDDSGAYVWNGEKPTTAYIPDAWDRFNAWSIADEHFYAIIGDVIMVDGVMSPEGVTYSNTIAEIPVITPPTQNAIHNGISVYSIMPSIA